MSKLDALVKGKRAVLEAERRAAHGAQRGRAEGGEAQGAKSCRRWHYRISGTMDNDGCDAYPHARKQSANTLTSLVGKERASGGGYPRC